MVLDPLEEIPDVDRLDNVFVQYVEFQDSVEFTPTCNVIGLGSGGHGKTNFSSQGGAWELSLLYLGRRALVTFNDIEDQRAVAFNARKRSYYKPKDEEANYARLLSQIGEISSDDTDNTCSGNIKDSKVRNIKI